MTQFLEEWQSGGPSLAQHRLAFPLVCVPPIPVQVWSNQVSARDLVNWLVL